MRKLPGPETKSFIYFEWERDPSGYQLSDDGLWLDAASGNMIRTWPLQFEELYLRFASIETVSDLLKFANKFGLPDTAKRDSVSYALSWANSFREVLKNPKRALQHQIKSDEADDLLLVRVVTEFEGAKASISFRPTTMLDAMRLQLAFALAGSGELHTCRECGTLFMCGPNEGRRRKSQYCCPEHQKSFSRRNRPKAPGQ